MRKTRCFLWLALVLTARMACAAAPASAPLPGQQQLVKYAVALLLYGDENPKKKIPADVPADQRRVWVLLAKRAYAGQRLFHAMPASELRRRLNPLFAFSRPRLPSSISVAYVLALHGVDLPDNLRRLAKGLNTNGLDGNGSPPVHLQFDADKEIYKSDWDWDSVSVSLPGAFANVARRNHQDFVLQAFLRLPTRDAPGEVHCMEIQDLFLERSRDVVRAAAVSNKDLDMLVGALTFEDAEGNMPKVKSRLRAMAKGNDPLLARASRRVLKSINAEEKKYGAVSG